MDIAIDTGGTFTDCVYFRDGALQVLKLLSTPADPGAALYACVRQAVSEETPAVRHGTTVGTNALLERKGARVAFVTTSGFEDTIAIGRQARANLYDWFATPPPCLVPSELRFGIAERTAADGILLQQPGAEEIAALLAKVTASGAESIAVSLLFSFANPANEVLVAKALATLGKPVSVSHVILPEFREFERAATIAANAFLAPKVGAYLDSLSNRLAETWPFSTFDVMQSSGGIVPAHVAAERPVYTVLSGPAGGVMGAFQAARQAGFDKIITFDMGGTSTDVSLIDGSEGGPVTTNSSIVSGIPISVPMLDIQTVGAGGGSIARFDAAGILQVGPQSAGATPGPICYGTATEPTVSDANLLLGRLRPQHFLGGHMVLDMDRTQRYLEAGRGSLRNAKIFATGIVRVANATMERAIRMVSVQRGYDPKHFTLVAFGGAGPLHACELARALRIPKVLVPRLPGALSAAGILLADSVRDYSKTVMAKSDANLEPLFEDLERTARAESANKAIGAIHTRSLDVRYVAQGYELNVPAGPDFVADFHAAHKRRYGYSDEIRDIEIVNVRLRSALPAAARTVTSRAMGGGNGAQAILEQTIVVFDGEPVPTIVYDRSSLLLGDAFDGPAILVEYSATTVIPPSCSARLDAFANVVIDVFL